MPRSEPIPELVLSSIFSELEPSDLLETTKNPITKAWRKYGLVEIFKRNAPEFWFFVARYIDYRFKHRSVIARSEFMDLLERSGLLGRWYELPSQQLSLLFGAIYPRNPVRGLVISASLRLDAWREIGENINWRNNEIISVYCLASSDKVRDALFKKLVSELYRPSTSQDFGFYRARRALLSLADYLTLSHQAQLLKEDLEALSPEESNHKIHDNYLEYDIDLYEQRLGWLKKNWCAWMGEDWHEIEDSAFYIGHRFSEEKKLSLLMKHVRSRVYPNEIIYKKIITHLSSIKLCEKLSDGDFKSLIDYCNNVAWPPDKRLLFSIHQQLPSIDVTLIFQSLTDHLFEMHDAIDAKSFGSLFLRLPEGVPLDWNVGAIPMTQYGFMLQLCRETEHQLEHDSAAEVYNGYILFYRPFKYFPFHMKQYVCKTLIEILSPEKSLLLHYKCLFLLTQFVESITQKQINQLFLAFTKKLDCTIENLHKKTDESYYHFMLMILSHVKQDHLNILGCDIHVLEDQFIEAAKSTGKLTYFLEHHYLYFNLSAENTTKALRCINSSKTISYFRKPIRYLGKKTQHDHCDLLHELNQTKSNPGFYLLTTALTFDHPEFTSGAIIKNSIRSCNGFYDYNKSGLFKGQPNRNFRELCACVDAMETNKVTVADGYTQLMKQAQELNLNELLEVLHERSLIDLKIQQQFAKLEF